jgi:hypothetical protein
LTELGAWLGKGRIILKSLLRLRGFSGSPAAFVMVRGGGSHVHSKVPKFNLVVDAEVPGAIRARPVTLELLIQQISKRSLSL